MSMGANYHSKYKASYENKSSLEKKGKRTDKYDLPNKYDKYDQEYFMKEDKEKEKGQKNKNKSPEKSLNYKYKVIDFDYSELESLLSDIDTTKENIALLVTGSFNPIHRMHIEILNIAYRYLLSLKKYNIICGFISPSVDCYVRKKKPLLIPFDLRCYMIETAIKEYEKENKNTNYLKLFLHTWEGTHEYFIDFPDVIKNIQNQLFDNFKKIDIQLVYVCGMDLYSQYNDYFDKNVIVVDRTPYKSYKYKNIPEKLIYIVKDKKAEPLSSTAIRNCYNKRDFIGINQITFPRVAQMVIKFYEKYYNNYYDL